MDSDVKQLLDSIREENASAHAETRQQFVVIAEGLSHEVQAVAGGLHEVRIETEGLRHEIQIVAGGLHEVRIEIEGLRYEIQTIAEGVTMTNEKIERIDAKLDKVAFGFGVASTSRIVFSALS